MNIGKYHRLLVARSESGSRHWITGYPVINGLSQVGREVVVQIFSDLKPTAPYMAVFGKTNEVF